MKNFFAISTLFTIFTTVLLPFSSGVAFAGAPVALSASPTGTETIQLLWTTDVEIVSHEIRYLTSPIDGSNFTSGTAVSGMPAPLPSQSQNVVVSGLAHGTTYYFAYQYKDTIDESAISTASATTDVGTIPLPGPVTGLTVSAVSASALTLSWSTPAGDELSSFDVRYSASAINDGNFDSATAVSGVPLPVASSNQSVVVSGLTAGTTYYFGMKVVNTVGEKSTLATTSGTTSGGIAVPNPVTGLAVSAASENALTLSWTTPMGDELSVIHVRRSTSAINDGNFDSATAVSGVPLPIQNSLQSVVVSGLTAGTAYYFGVKVENTIGGFSALVTTSGTTNAASGGGGGGSTPASGGGGGGSGTVFVVPDNATTTISTSSVSFLINNGATSTESRVVNLSISVPNASEMEVSNLVDFSDAVWGPYATSTSWVLISGGGLKTVYAQFRDASSTTIGTASSTIWLVSGEVLGVATSSLPKATIKNPVVVKKLSVTARTPACTSQAWFSLLPENVTISRGKDFNLVIVAHPGKCATNLAQMQLIYPSDLVTIKSIEYANGWEPVLGGSESNDAIPGVLERTARYSKELTSSEVFVIVTFTPKKNGTAVFGFENNQITGKVSSKAPVESKLAVIDRESHLFASALSTIAENNVAATIVMWAVFAVFYGLSFALK